MIWLIIFKDRKQTAEMSFEQWPSLVRPRLLANAGLEQEEPSVKPQLVDPRTPYQLAEILEGYSEQSLTIMSQKRGLVMPWEIGGGDGTTNGSLKKPRANLRKSQLISEIADAFYDPASLEAALEKLSPAARFGMALLKHKGGIMRRLFWLMEIGERYGAEGIYQAESELVGSALALYAGTDTRRPPQAAPLRFRHVYTTYLNEIGSPAFMAESWLYLPVSIQQLFEPDPALLQQLAPAQVQPYAGIVARVDQPATHNLNVLLTDLFSFIRYIEREKFRIVQSGEISKRDTTRLLAVLSRSNSAGSGGSGNGQKKKARPSDKIILVSAEGRPEFKGKTQLEIEVDKRKEEGWLSFLWHLLKLSGLVEEEETVSMTTALSHPELVAEFYALVDYQQARLLLLNWLDSDDNEFWRIPTLRFRELSSFSSLSESRDIPHPYRLTLARQLVLIKLQKLLIEEEEEAALAISGTATGQGTVRGTGLGGGWQDLPSFIAMMRENYPELLIDRRPLNYYAYSRQHGPIYQGLTSRLKGEGESLRLDLDWRLVEGEWLIQLFREPLAWLGLAELGLNEEGQPVAFRLTELGRKAFFPSLPVAQPESSASASQAGMPLERSLIVQPNFEILVLQPLQQLAVLNKLDEFATQQSLGEVALYRLSKESILTGLRRGLVGNEIVAFLEQHSAVPLSQNLVISIVEWAAGYERLLLYPSTTLLEVSDPTQLDQLMSTPENIQRLGLLKRVGPTFALLKGPPPPPVIEKLLPLPLASSPVESISISALQPPGSRAHS